MPQNRTKTRHEQILSLLRATQKEWKVEELAATLATTPLTVRRDLQVLADQGAILRTHGGCLAAGRAALETEYHKRVAHNFAQKQAIGAAAAAEIKPGSTILINDGSTTYHLAAQLGNCASLTVYTNSIAMLTELSRHSGIAIHILGGRYKAALHYLGGALTERVLEFLEFDAVFMGADAIGPEGQCLVFDAEEARTAQVMLRHSRRKILLADPTKTQVRGNVAYATLADFDLWITSPGLTPALRRHLGAMTQLREV